MTVNDRIYELEENYQLKVDDCFGQIEDLTWLKELALSPRGIIGRKKEDKRSPWGVSCCMNCKNAIVKGHTPLYAIVNQNFVGHAPQVLQDLTPVELALISPVKGYGYCFSYVGGTNMNLKGTMTL